MSKKTTDTNTDNITRHKKLASYFASNYITGGETGILNYPYSKKIHKHWEFETPDLALASAKKIHNIFVKNIESSLPLHKKFVRADICRKFLQMGYTQSMRHYYQQSENNWKNIDGIWIILPEEYDAIKKFIADIFKIYLDKCVNNKKYQQLKKEFINEYSR